MQLDRSVVVLVLALTACDLADLSKEEPESPLVDGKADRFATDFVLAGELAPGGALPGALTDTDRFLGYTFYARSGDDVDVSIASGATGLDSVLWIYGPYDADRARWSTKPLAVNDDHGSAKLSAIDVALPSDGMYLAIVTSYQQRTRGAFEIALSCLGCSTAPRAGDLVINELHARPIGDAATGDADGNQTVDPDADEYIEVRNVARVPVAVANVELVTGGAAIHPLPQTTLLGPGQALVAFGPLGLDDDGATIALRLGGMTLDEISYATSATAGSLVRIEDASGVTFQPHLDVTQGTRALSPGVAIDGSPYPNPNTSTTIDVSTGADAIEDARFAAEAAVAARFGKSIPVTINDFVFLGPALQDKDIAAGLRRFTAALPELRHPDASVTHIVFGAGDTWRWTTRVYVDVHDDGRQSFRVLSTTPTDEPAYTQFVSDARAAFATDLPAVARIEERLLAWLPTPTVHPASYLSAAGVTVTSYKLETSYYGTMKEYRSDKITIDLAASYPNKINVTIDYAKSSTTVSGYYVRYSQTTLGLFKDAVRTVRFDAMRRIQYGHNFMHDTATGRLLRRTFLDEDYNIERLVHVNVPLLPRDSIAIDDSDPTDAIYEGLAQRSTTRGRTIVGIFDSGIDYNHPALVHKLHENSGDGDAEDGVDSDGNGKRDDFVGWDFDDDDRLPFDYNDFLLNFAQSFDHGTHVGGIAGQGTEDIRLLPVRWKIHGATLAAAVDYMASRGVQIVNMSFSSTLKSTMDPLGAKIAASPHMLFVAAAGNDGENLETKPRYPASFTADNLITVAAVDDKSALTSWSNYGAVSCDLAAPGDAIFNTVVGGGWGAKSGTSMATPYVVNVAAKMLALAPALTPTQLKRILMTTVDIRADFAGKVVSQGVVNAARAQRVAWLWQRTREGDSAANAVTQLGLAQAEATRLVGIVTAL